MLDTKEMAAADTSAAPEIAFRDEEGGLRADYVERVSDAIEKADAAALRELVPELHEADMGDLIEALDPALRPRLIELLGADFDFTALTEVDDTVRDEILEELPPETVAEGVRELDSDDAAELLEDLPKEEQDEILEQLPAHERTAVERLLKYPEDTAGRRMQTEFIAVPPFWTVGQTIDHMRETVDLPDRFFELYVVHPAHRFRGVVALDRLLRTKRPVPISELVEAERHKVHAADDLEDVARRFEHYNLIAVPVVDEADRLVGVITVDDIVDVITKEADEDVKALGGVSRDEELSDSVWTIARSRFPWLLANLATALLASWVIRHFEDSLSKMVALAVLMPIVASMGGNAGTQTMTVAVRAIATRDLGPANSWRFLRRELFVGVLNGLSFALIMGVIAALWFNVADIGVVIGLAMLTVLIVAAVGGFLIPLVLTRLGADPAVSSGPFVTTITDVVGFASFLGIATIWFGLR
jgi:magnesium transporter